MICKQCGASLRPGGTSCPKCGARQEPSLECGGFPNLAAQAREGAGGFSVPGDPGKPASGRPAPPPAASRPAPARPAPPVRRMPLLSLVPVAVMVVCLVLSIVSCSKMGELQSAVEKLENRVTQLEDELNDQPEDENPPHSSAKPDSTTEPQATLPGETGEPGYTPVSARSITFTMDASSGTYTCSDPDFQCQSFDQDGSAMTFSFLYSGSETQSGEPVTVTLNLNEDGSVTVSYDLKALLFGSRENSFLQCRWYNGLTGQDVAEPNLQLDSPNVTLAPGELKSLVQNLCCEIIRDSDDGGQVTFILENIPAFRASR